MRTEEELKKEIVRILNVRKLKNSESVDANAGAQIHTILYLMGETIFTPSEVLINSNRLDHEKFPKWFLELYKLNKKPGRY